MNKPRLFPFLMREQVGLKGWACVFWDAQEWKWNFPRKRLKQVLAWIAGFLHVFFFPVPKGNGWIASLSFFNLHDRYLIFSNLLFLQDTFLFLWIFYFFDTHTHLVFFGLGVQWVALCGVPAWVWPHARPSPTENPDGDLFYLFSSPGKFEGFWQTTNLTR